MAFSLPNPTTPTNGQSLDATPILANETAIAQAIASFDGSQIQAGTVTNSALAANIQPNALINAITFPFVSSGCVWSATTGLTGTMSGGTIYYGGTPITVNSVSSHTFTASNDTYIDIDKNANITYQGVSNNGSAPSLTANSIRVAKVITGASAITSVILTGVDSNNVQIYPTNPQGFGNYISWSPTIANFTLGNGTVAAHYSQMGKTILYHIEIQMGSTSSMGSGISFTLPVTSSSAYATNAQTIGTAVCFHAGDGSTIGAGAFLPDTTHVGILVLGAAGTYTNYVASTSTVPFTWATSDKLTINGSYEAA